MDIDGVWISPTMAPRLCKLLGVHRTTLARWLKPGRLPTAVQKLLSIILQGDLAAISDEWHGFSVDHHNGRLWTPLGQSFSATEIQAIPLRYQQMNALRLENKELRIALNESQDTCRRNVLERRFG